MIGETMLLAVPALSTARVVAAVVSEQSPNCRRSPVQNKGMNGQQSCPESI